MISPPSAAAAPGGMVSFQTNLPAESGVAWSVNGTSGGNSTVGTIDANGNFTAASAAQSSMVTISAVSNANANLTATAQVFITAPGTVAATPNPQVATYTISPPAGASVSIQFGTDTSYGLTTSTQMAPAGGGSVSFFVAGMLQSTLYHMRAAVQFTGGPQFNDADHMFTTGTVASPVPKVTMTTTPGMTPQPGIEMFDSITNGLLGAFATDLSGNVIWTYSFLTGTDSASIQPIKLLSNGHLLVCITFLSSLPLHGGAPAGAISLVREIDLAGNTIHEIDISTLNSRLASGGFNLVALAMHHDVTPLPNGHWILIVNSTREFTDLTGLPGTTTVLGDALVDLDENQNPVWVWNTFDHLDVNRHPFMFPDWTHANAVLYSATDGDLVLSMRHQNWVIKIDYNNGTGTGNIVWHLGEGGDFTLMGGTDPTDWFYAQHGPSFLTSTTAGKFSLALFDNGDDRMFPAGDSCVASAAHPCPYSTVPIFNLDETAKTADLAFHDILPAYSFFGGNAEVLANGNVEFDESATSQTSPQAAAFEVTQTATPTVVWQTAVSNAYVYREFRMGSLYPGVQWP